MTMNLPVTEQMLHILSSGSLSGVEHSARGWDTLQPELLSFLHVPI